MQATVQTSVRTKLRTGVRISSIGLVSCLAVFCMAPALAGDEYANIPAGILLDPALAKKEASTPVEAAPAVDPQVPTHSISNLTPQAVVNAAPAAPQNMEEIRKAYAAGAFDTVITPLETLAAQDDMQAVLLLAIMQESGQGLPAADPARAVDLLTRAANSGLPLAQHRLAILFYQGKGVAKDDVKAMMWLHVAVAKYPPGAERDRAMADRGNLDAALSRRDRDTALLLAREWLEERGETHLLQP